MKQRIQKGADGSKAFIGWYDSQRDEECAFTKATDGKTRCLPQVPYATVGPYYSNATCTSPLYLATKGCAAPKLVLLQEGGDQCGFPRAAAVKYTTNKIPESAQIYVGGASCTATAQPNTYDFYGIGATVPPGDFVEGSEERL